MPHYEYFCESCQKSFELALTLREHEEKIQCPKCGSENVNQLVSTFTAVTSKKS